MKRTKLWIAIGALFTASFVAGCGGDDDSSVEGGQPPGTGAGSVPDSASASVSAFLDFLQSLNSSDTAEPLSIGDGFKPPTDDTGDPRPLT